jgi:hypothetical protein
MECELDDDLMSLVDTFAPVDADSQLIGHKDNDADSDTDSDDDEPTMKHNEGADNTDGMLSMLCC